MGHAAVITVITLPLFSTYRYCFSSLLYYHHTVHQRTLGTMSTLATANDSTIVRTSIVNIGIILTLLVAAVIFKTIVVTGIRKLIAALTTLQGIDDTGLVFFDTIKEEWTDPDTVVANWKPVKVKRQLSTTLRVPGSRCLWPCLPHQLLRLLDEGGFLLG